VNTLPRGADGLKLGRIFRHVTIPDGDIRLRDVPDVVRPVRKRLEERAAILIGGFSQPTGKTARTRQPFHAPVNAPDGQRGEKIAAHAKPSEQLQGFRETPPAVEQTLSQAADHLTCSESLAMFQTILVFALSAGDQQEPDERQQRDHHERADRDQESVGQDLERVGDPGDVEAATPALPGRGFDHVTARALRQNGDDEIVGCLSGEEDGRSHDEDQQNRIPAQLRENAGKLSGFSAGQGQRRSVANDRHGECQQEQRHHPPPAKGGGLARPVQVEAVGARQAGS